jgi:hypothetical protein
MMIIVMTGGWGHRVRGVIDSGVSSSQGCRRVRGVIESGIIESGIIESGYHGVMCIIESEALLRHWCQDVMETKVPLISV